MGSTDFWFGSLATLPKKTVTVNLHSDRLKKLRVQVDRCRTDPNDPDSTHYCVIQHKKQGTLQGTTCRGDSGSPLLCKDSENRWILSGLVSWGPKLCQAHLGEAGYARLDEHLKEVLLTSTDCAYDNWDVPPSKAQCDQMKDGPMCEESITCGTTKAVPYLIGGYEALPFQYPFFAVVQAQGSGQTCGGALISPTKVVTSKNCLIRPDKTKIPPQMISVFLGSSEGIALKDPYRQEVKVQSYCTSKRYIRTTGARLRREQTLAVLTLQSSVAYSQRVQPACWPYKHRGPIYMDTSHPCVVVGLGIIELKERAPARYLRMIPVNQTECSTYGKGYLCLESSKDVVGVCEDRGSPVLCRDSSLQWTLVGVIEGPNICRTDGQMYASQVDPDLDTGLATCSD